MAQTDDRRDFNLTCWYLNLRRVAELVGIDAGELGTLSSISDLHDQLRTLSTLAYFKGRIADWMRVAQPPTLDGLILKGELRQGAFFTHYAKYTFKGLPAVDRAMRKGGVPVPMAEGYAKLDVLKPGLVARFKFHHDHLTSSSSWSELSGQKDVLVVGIVSNVTDDEIQITPYVIAYPFISFMDPDRPSIVGDRWQWGLETFPSQIDEFARIRDFDAPRSAKDLDLLRGIPEADVKQAFAEILGEPTVPKDWGGERSDLFTSVQIEGKRVSAAFAFKGPAKFHAMTMADLGKNGDQIDRLFSEPADIMVLQHCHEITPPVRGMMRAFATRMGQLKTFCIINGFETLRILNAYDKCGLGGTYKRRSVGP